MLPFCLVKILLQFYKHGSVYSQMDKTLIHCLACSGIDVTLRPSAFHNLSIKAEDLYKIMSRILHISEKKSESFNAGVGIK